MNVAIFASAFHPALGGVEEVVRQLSHALQRQGHSAIVITNRWPRNLPEEDSFEEIPIYRLPLRAPEFGIKSRVTYLLTHRAVARAIASILRKRAIDVINVHCVSANALYARRASRQLNLPLVVTSHSERTMDATHIFERSAFMNKVLRDSLLYADALTACSQNTLDDLVEFTSDALCAHRRVIYNGVDLAEFDELSPPTPSRATPYVLALGRFVRPKGFDVLLRAFAASGAAKSHQLILAGDGPERAALEELIGELDLRPAVILCGQVDRAQALAYMRDAEFFVLSSRHEGFPMVCLEAMGARRAIIATAVGGVPESVCDGKTGLLVPKENVDALAQAIARLISNKPLCAAYGSAGRKRVEALTWNALASEYLEVYGAAAERRSCKS